MAYKAKTFIDAIPGTGGVITSIAKKVGCDWTTAKKYIEEYPTVHKVWLEEKQSVDDKAQYNIIEAIVKHKDLSMSKWWLQVKNPEFVPKADINNTGEITVQYVNDWRDTSTDSA